MRIATGEYEPFKVCRVLLVLYMKLGVNGGVKKRA